jgi:hypothetical protein
MSFNRSNRTATRRSASGRGRSFTVGAHEELGQIVAGDVLDDLAAAAYDRAVAGDRGHPDEQIARGAVEMPAGTGRVGGDHAADGGAVRLRRVQRQPLAARPQRGLQRGDRDPGLCGDRQIPGLVLEQPGHPREGEDEPGP